MRMLFIVLTMIALLAGAGGWYWHVSSKPHVEYRTAKVKRGDLLATIGATGTIEPEEVVDVGAQVTGPIAVFGNDANGKRMDYCSPVEAGMLLAKIDDTTYKADRDTSAAMLEQAKASLQKAEADLRQTQGALHQALGNWTRAKELGPSDALSKNDYDMYQANFETASANVEVSDSEVRLAKAGIVQAQAALDKAQRNLDFCTIVSPVKGVIIDRRVNVGQTVVGQLSPASMFLIAQDLSKMQIWVAVNEADISHIFPGQHVEFTCDGFDGSFSGTVNRVRYFAAVTQNVVTYTVEVNFINPGGKLLPYRTANVNFELEKDANVLLVPNSALRWYPSDRDAVVPDARSQWKPVESEEREKPTMGEMPSPPPKKDKNGKLLPRKKPDRLGMIWLTEGQYVRPLQVKVGTTDGVDTEISAADLKEGTEVVDGEIVQTAQEGQERNPFLPQMKHH